MKPPPFPDLAQRMRVRTECTGSNLRRATRAVSRIYDEALAPAGLRGTQFSLLIALSFFKEAPLLRVAEEGEEPGVLGPGPVESLLHDPGP